MNNKFEFWGKSFNTILAFFIVCACFIFFYILLFKGVQNLEKDILLFILGAITTILSQIVSYFYGSSKNSSDKTQVIKDLTGKKDNIGP